MILKSLDVNGKVHIGSILRTDLHMHTIYCDGRSTPEQMVLSAIGKGMECIGFSGHSYVEFDKGCGMDEKNAALYFDEISRLKEKYRDRIRIYCGVEQDDCSVTDTTQYDYVIGSVHYLRIPLDEAGKAGLTASKRDDCFVYISVDDTPQELMDAAKDYFDNDHYALAENYYEALSRVVLRTDADIIGHFDLVSKFNEKCPMFDVKDPRYTAAWKKAADALLNEGRIFEINTGGISRGWRSTAYPAPFITDYLEAGGGRFILSSDSHDAETVGDHSALLCL